MHLRLSIFFCFFSGDIYLSLGISLSFSFATVSELFCCEFFDIPSLYYFNLSSSIISCPSPGDTYFSAGISLVCSFVTVSELFCCEFFETPVILLTILLPIKSPVVASAVS